MQALRLPFAAATGALLSAAMFLGLWALVSRPIEVGERAPQISIDFTPQRHDTPLKSKRDPKVVRTTPPPVPTNVSISATVGDVEVTPAVFKTAPAVDLRGHGTGLPVGSDREAIPIVRFAPEYPPREVARGTEGWVQVQFTITAAGTVRDAQVVAADPPRVFDEAALKAIVRWRYNPRIDGGVAVERVGMQTLIRFTLDE
jgi:periplasmic protein TonB